MAFEFSFQLFLVFKRISCEPCCPYSISFFPFFFRFFSGKSRGIKKSSNLNLTSHFSSSFFCETKKKYLWLTTFLGSVRPLTTAFFSAISPRGGSKYDVFIVVVAMNQWPMERTGDQSLESQGCQSQKIIIFCHYSNKSLNFLLKYSLLPKIQLHEAI